MLSDEQVQRYWDAANGLVDADMSELAWRVGMQNLLTDRAELLEKLSWQQDIIEAFQDNQADLVARLERAEAVAAAVTGLRDSGGEWTIQERVGILNAWIQRKEGPSQQQTALTFWLRGIVDALAAYQEANDETTR